MKGAPFAATAALHAADFAGLPPSGEQADTRLTGSVGAPCDHAGAAAVSSRGAARATVATVAAARCAEKVRCADKRSIRNVRSIR
ncbi:hypothetical protein SGFS_033780 [Streptomyces graminofaciens]|uniref:Uncharacterized protein n=1 Tax=Streptomyces graminofaciens TaxID=68212 RepID=A0ABN5VFQ8_9ACTN|nr:hypothetical protein SGFS_033780 [Streptomyces graminofaciens]